MTNPTRTVVSNYYDDEIDESDEYMYDGEAAVMTNPTRTVVSN